jgi:hypothetical protein
VNVELTIEEARVAAMIAVERRLRAIARGREHRFNWNGEGAWENDLHATGAELAVAKALGRYWTDTAAPDSDGDVGAGVQVRWTRHPGGHLILHPSDHDMHRYVLVTGLMPRYTIRGWCSGVGGKRGNFWRGGLERPAFFVPQSALRELSTLVGT